MSVGDVKNMSLGDVKNVSLGDVKKREEDRRRDGKITSKNGREWGLEIP